MKRIVKDYIDNINILRANIIGFVKYLICTKALFLIVMLPLFKVTINLLMKSKGYTYLTNGLILKFLLSTQGLITIMLGFILAISAILIELGGLIVLSYQAIKDKPESSFIEIVRYCLKKFGVLIRFDGLIIVFYLFLVLPFLDSGIRTSIFTNINIPGFILDVIESNIFYLIILISIIIAFLILSLKWVFTLHIIVLHKRSSKSPFQESSKIVKKNFKPMIGYFIGNTIFGVILLALMSVFYFLLAVFILVLAGETYQNTIAMGFIGLGMTIIGLIEFLVLPYQILYTTKFYCKVQKDKEFTVKLRYKQKDSAIDKILRNKKVVIPVAVIVVAVSVVTIVFPGDYPELFNYDIAITAHRGSSDEAPENTIAAIDKAIENGADYVEIDVQETKDGHLVLLHDQSLGRTTGLEKNIWEVTLSEVKNLDAGSYFSQEYKGVKVPTLDEVIQYTVGKIKLNIEIKIHGHESNITSKVVNLIKENQLFYSSVVTSLNYSVLKKIEESEPRIKTGYIMYIALGELENLEIDFYSVEKSNVTDSFVQKAHSSGREVHVWTINKEDEMEEVINMGVDNIITDNVVLLKEKFEKMITDNWSFVDIFFK